MDRNRPGKTEEYLMQVALRIVQFAGFGGGPDRGSIPLDSQRLKWNPAEVQPAYSQRELAQRSSAVTRAALVGSAQGGGARVKLVDGPRVPLPPGLTQSVDEVEDGD